MTANSEAKVVGLKGTVPSHYTAREGGPWMPWHSSNVIHNVVIHNGDSYAKASATIFTDNSGKIFISAHSLKFTGPEYGVTPMEWDAHHGWRNGRQAEKLTEGTKFDGEKPRADLLSVYSIDQLIAVLTFGAQKYDDHNWRKGIKTSRLLAAALRHIFAYMGGEDKDKETGLSHIAHAMCCCMFIIEQDKYRKEFDDRYKLPAVKK